MKNLCLFFVYDTLLLPEGSRKFFSPVSALTLAEELKQCGVEDDNRTDNNENGSVFGQICTRA